MELTLKSVAYDAVVVSVMPSHITCDICDTSQDKFANCSSGMIGKVDGIRFNRKENRLFQMGDLVQVYVQQKKPLVLSLDKQFVRPLLIFDVHGVLGERTPFHGGGKFNKKSGTTREFVTRPHCKEFLEFCFEHFEVAVWSSALSKNLALPMFRSGTGKNSPLFVWSQREITDLSPVMSFRKSSKPLHLKEISKVWELFPSYDSFNSLLLDNDMEKCAVSELEGSTVCCMLYAIC